MADNEPAPDDGLDPNALPPEGEDPPAHEIDPNVNDSGEGDQQPDPIEALASELGWAPKDQFRGDPEAWRPADEFIRVGREIERKVSRELKDVRATVENMSRTQAAILEQQIAEREAQLEARRIDAIEAGDVRAVNEIDGERQQLRQNGPAQPAPSPEAQAFVERNSAWYGKNQEATQYAFQRAEHYAREGLNNPARQLQAVERDMKQHFPELFPAPTKAPPSVARPARTATATNRSKGFHDLPSEAQAVARDMVERGVIASTDDYVKNWDFGRKVG